MGDDRSYNELFDMLGSMQEHCLDVISKYETYRNNYSGYGVSIQETMKSFFNEVIQMYKMVYDAIEDARKNYYKYVHNLHKYDYRGFFLKITSAYDDMYKEYRRILGYVALHVEPIDPKRARQDQYYNDFFYIEKTTEFIEFVYIFKSHTMVLFKEFTKNYNPKDFSPLPPPRHSAKERAGSRSRARPREEPPPRPSIESRVTSSPRAAEEAAAVRARFAAFVPAFAAPSSSARASSRGRRGGSRRTKRRNRPT